jgi:hypothetical protein
MRKNTLWLLLVMLGLILYLAACGPRASTTPKVEEAPQLRYPDKDTYIEEVVITLELVRGTLKIASEASRDLADGRMTRQEFREVAVLGRQNLERARVDMSSIVPPSEVIIAKTTFEDMHDELMSGIEWYIKAFDEMIKYGDDGRISHINKATDYIENFGDPYINVVTYELRIAQKKQ